MPIDPTTSVPKELFDRLVVAGKNARESGQHRIVTKEEGADSEGEIPRQVLFNNNLTDEEYTRRLNTAFQRERDSRRREAASRPALGDQKCSTGLAAAGTSGFSRRSSGELSEQQSSAVAVSGGPRLPDCILRRAPPASLESRTLSRSNLQSKLEVLLLVTVILTVNLIMLR